LVLVMTQVRFIGRWTRKYGESKVVALALALLAVGLILFALTPEQPHPFYVRQIVQKALQTQSASSTEALIGEIAVPLPENGHNGIGGLLWLLAVIVPISVGAGLIRPSLNSLMTQRVSRDDYGGILGLSSSVVSAANAVAPIAGGLLFQQFGSTMPFLLGGVVMAVLFLFSWRVVKSPTPTPAAVS
jgi:MFS family permease